MENAVAFLKKLWKLGHQSVFEHVNLTCYIKMDRGLLQELARHRHNSLSVESTRFIKYETGNFEAILPGEVVGHPYEETYKADVTSAFEKYTNALNAGLSPQIARGLLPNVLAVQLYTTANLRQWVHIFNLRWVNKSAHPDMRRLMQVVANEFHREYPILFGEILELDRMAEYTGVLDSLDVGFKHEQDTQP